MQCYLIELIYFDISSHQFISTTDIIDNSKLEWPCIDDEGFESFFDLDLSTVNHEEFFFYGIDDNLLQKLKSEMTVPPVKKGNKSRSQFEIPATGIRSKFDGYSIMAGKGIKITKTNYGVQHFYVVSLLWSSNDNFSFLLAEREQFMNFESFADAKQGDSYSFIIAQ